MPGKCARVGVVAVLLWCGLALAQTDLRKNVGHIYVGSMGMSDEADEFRTMLAYELGRGGFKVVDFEQQATSVLTGLLSTRVSGGQSVVRATVFLKSRDGKTLWTGDFGDAPATRNKDTLRLRAEEVTKALQRASSKAKTMSPAKSAIAR